MTTATTTAMTIDMGYGLLGLGLGLRNVRKIENT